MAHESAGPHTTNESQILNKQLFTHADDTVEQDFVEVRYMQC